MRILLASTTAIGDTIMATPFLRAVREKYPEAEITLMAHHRRIELLEFNPNVDHYLVYPGKGKGLPSLLWKLRKASFDLVIILHANDPDIVPLIRWTGAPQRVGWGESRWAGLLTHTILRTSPPEHFLIHKKRLLESVGIPVEKLQMELYLQESDYVKLNESLMPWLERRGGKYVVMHAFGTNPMKWWPLDRFLKMAQWIYQRSGWPTVWIGDAEACTLASQHPEYSPEWIHLAEGYRLRESAAVVSRAHRMLTTDSGPMHMAFAFRVPCFALFGPTKPSVHGPLLDQERHHVIHEDPLERLRLERVQSEWDSWSQSLNSVPL